MKLLEQANYAIRLLKSSRDALQSIPECRDLVRKIDAFLTDEKAGGVRIYPPKKESANGRPA